MVYLNSSPLHFGLRISLACVCIFLLIAQTPCFSLGLMETLSYK